MRGKLNEKNEVFILGVRTYLVAYSPIFEGVHDESRELFCDIIVGLSLSG